MENTQIDQFDTDGFRKNIIQAEREKYLRGEGKSLTWEEVKNMAGKAQSLLDKGRDKADATWDEKGYTDEKLQQILGNK